MRKKFNKRILLGTGVITVGIVAPMVTQLNNQAKVLNNGQKPKMKNKVIRGVASGNYLNSSLREYQGKYFLSYTAKINYVDILNLYNKIKNYKWGNDSDGIHFISDYFQFLSNGKIPLKDGIYKFDNQTFVNPKYNLYNDINYLIKRLHNYEWGDFMIYDMDYSYQFVTYFKNIFRAININTIKSHSKKSYIRISDTLIAQKRKPTTSWGQEWTFSSKGPIIKWYS